MRLEISGDPEVAANILHLDANPDMELPQQFAASIPTERDGIALRCPERSDMIERQFELAGVDGARCPASRRNDLVRDSCPVIDTVERHAKEFGWTRRPEGQVLAQQPGLQIETLVERLPIRQNGKKQVLFAKS